MSNNSEAIRTNLAFNSCKRFRSLRSKDQITTTFQSNCLSSASCFASRAALLSSFKRLSFFKTPKGVKRDP